MRKFNKRSHLLKGNNVVNVSLKIKKCCFFDESNFDLIGSNRAHVQRPIGTRNHLTC